MAKTTKQGRIVMIDDFTLYPSPEVERAIFLLLKESAKKENFRLNSKTVKNGKTK